MLKMENEKLVLRKNYPRDKNPGSQRRREHEEEVRKESTGPGEAITFSKVEYWWVC